MESQELAMRRRVERLLAVAMKIYNGDRHNDNKEDEGEILESLRKQAYKAHRAFALPGHLPLSVDTLTIDDVEVMFPTLRFNSKQKAWMKKRVAIAGFRFHTLRAHRAGSNAMIKLHLDILFNSVLTNIQPRAPGIRYEKDVTCSLDPVKFKGDTYQLYGTADYVLEYDEREKGAANLVVLSAGRLGFKCSEERPNYACCGMAQIVALMSMIHHHRKTHEQGDCTVYGICTDLIDFWFFQIDEKGEVSFMLLTAKILPRYIEYQEIMGLLAYIFNEAVVLSQRKTKFESNGSQIQGQAQLKDKSPAKGS